MPKAEEVPLQLETIMAAIEAEFRKPFHEQVFVFLGVVGPLVATVYAINQLWQQYVDWSDIALMIVSSCNGTSSALGMFRNQRF